LPYYRSTTRHFEDADNLRKLIKKPDPQTATCALLFEFGYSEKDLHGRTFCSLYINSMHNLDRLRTNNVTPKLERTHTLREHLI
jgi:hypothetical protein